MSKGQQEPTAAARPRALRYAAGRTQRVIDRKGTAAEVIGRLAPGVRVTGLTGGQFSAIDAMEHIVDELGPAEVRVSTWTTGLYDVTRAAGIRQAGRIERIRILLDRGTFEKSPRFAGPLIEALGVAAFRCLSVHAKVILVHGARGAAALRTSMNLNKNLRTEQFDLDVCDEVAGFYAEWFDALWDECGRGRDNVSIIAAVYDRFRALPEQSGGAQAPAAGRRRRAGEVELSADDLSAIIGL